MIKETALAFDCHGDWLYGVLAMPEQSAATGVLVIVGGPQYRAGSHRQFTSLARQLARDGVPAMRFDVRGMGDSDGEQRSFDALDEDIRAAIDHFMEQAPGLRQVVLWGLCDGASAAMLYAPTDARVAGLALLNPWARTDDGLARATIKHYYRRRLFAPELWRKICSGRFSVTGAARSALQLLRRARTTSAASLPQRLHTALAAYRGPVLLMLSGADLTAQEFAGLADTAPEWRALLAAPRVTVRRLAGADHTCSRPAWQDQVAHWSSEWVRQR